MLSLEEYDTSDIIKILVTANELGLQELVVYIQSFLLENKRNWVEQNFNLIYQTSFENDSFSELRKYCTELITKHPDKIFKSPNFSSTPEKLLLSVVQNGNLQISEVEIWEHVLKWGYVQNPGLPSDPTSLSKEEFSILKNTLQQFIPFINFYNLTSREFSDKILPYKKILPKELYKDLFKTFLNLADPNSKPSDKSKPHMSRISESNLKNFDSKIISAQAWFRQIQDSSDAQKAAGIIQVWFRKAYERRQKYRKHARDQILDKTYNDIRDFCCNLPNWEVAMNQKLRKYHMLMRGLMVDVIVELNKLQDTMDKIKNKLQKTINIPSTDLGKLESCLELKDDLKFVDHSFEISFNGFFFDLSFKLLKPFEFFRYIHYENVKSTLEVLSITENSVKHEEVDIEWLKNELQDAEIIIEQVTKWINDARSLI